MHKDDETTATQLHELLVNNGISISLRTILRCRKQVGWTFRGSAYCQQTNKQKRLEWALQHRTDDFGNSLMRLLFKLKLTNYVVTERKGKGQKPKSRPKHPVHVWAGN